jgi:hypothetical protein
MAAKYPVKFFKWSQGGAPTLSNQWGDLITVLNAVLVDGFNLRSLDSLVQVGGIATATVSAGHGYERSQIINITGCDQTNYNGEQKILTVTTTTFTFAVDPVTVSPATTASTIAAKVAPLGFERPFTGTATKQVYRSPNTKGNRPFLRVDNGVGQAGWGIKSAFGRVSMSDTMIDIDTHGSNVAPFDPVLPNKSYCSGGWFKWYHSGVANYDLHTQPDPPAGPRSWYIIGTDRMFYLMCTRAHVDSSIQPLDATFRDHSTYAFGEFDSYKQGDPFNALLLAHENYLGTTGTVTDPNAGYYFSQPNVMAQGGNIPLGGGDIWGGQILLKDVNVLSGPVKPLFCTLGINQGSSNYSGNPQGIGTALSLQYPNPADQALVLHPSYILQSTDLGKTLRGILPGYVPILNKIPQNNGTTSQPFSSGQILRDIPNFPGQEFMIVVNSQDNVRGVTYNCFSISGDWFK